MKRRGLIYRLAGWAMFYAGLTLAIAACGRRAVPMASAGSATTQPAGPAFVVSGEWRGSTLPGPRQEIDSYWTAQRGATAIWTPVFESPVRARVGFYKIVHSGENDPAVQVEVVHAGRTEVQTVDCSTGQTGWVELGIFDFAGGEAECVRLTKTTPGGSTRASAVRFEVLGAGGGVIQSFTLDQVTAGPLFQPPVKFDPSVVRPGPPDPAEWTLVFADEFDGTMLDSKVWAVEAGAPGHILSSRWPENVQLKGGILWLLTRKELRGGKEWTTGNIWTRQFQPQYGYFEARMRSGRARGLNNAFWLSTNKKRTDPVHFEIDVCEVTYPAKNHMSLHNWAGEHWAKGKQWRAPYNLSDDFHLYSLLWDEKQLIWYVDGQEIHRLAHDICHLPVPVRLSSAVGTFAGSISDALDGTAMEVDYVRVWQKKD